MTEHLYSMVFFVVWNLIHTIIYCCKIHIQYLVTPPEIGTMAISTSFKAGTPAWELEDECLREWLIAKRFSTRIYNMKWKKIHVTKKVILQRGIQWNFELIEYES